MLSPRALLSALALGAALLSGCPQDVDSPLPPEVDPLPSVTSLEHVLVAGRAEYLAAVEVKSQAGTASTTADPETGRFAIDVALAEGANTLIIAATDAAGNRSEEVHVEIAREPLRAEQIRIALESQVVNADDGRLAVQVIATNDEAVDLSQLGVTVRVEDYGDEIAPVRASLDDSGAARVVLEGLDRVGSGRVVAEADVASLDGSKARAEAGFFVISGAPAAVDLSLSAIIDGAPVGPAAELSVPPATDVTAEVAVTDAAGNTVTGIPLSLDVQGGTASVVGNVIRDANRAGTYRVVAQLGQGLLAGEAILTVIPGAADRLEIQAAPSSLAAGDTVTVIARAFDAWDNVVPGFDITLLDDVPDVDLLGGAQELIAAATADGLEGSMQIRTAGLFTFTARDAAGQLASPAATVRVEPAAPANANFFELDLAGAPYQAGEPVPFTYSFVDAWGNATYDVPLQVTVNAPNVLVTNDGQGAVEVNGLVRAGTYTVRARALGTGLPDDVETVVIEPNPEDAGLNLILSSGLIVEGGTALFFAADGFGNEIPADQLVVTSSDPSVVQSGNQLTFTAPGTYSVTVCLAAQPTLCDTEFIGVQGILDTVPPTVTVTIETPSPAVTSDVPQRGQVVFRIDASDDRGLSQLNYVATFGNIGTCTRSDGPVYIPGGTTTTSFTFSFSVPGCAAPLDEIHIVAQATDEAGNSRNSGPHTPLFVQSPFDFASPGFLVTVAAWRDRLDIPQDVAADPHTGQLFVSNFGDDRVIVVNQDRFQSDLRDPQGNRVRPIEPRGLSFDAAGDLFVHVVDAGNGPAGVLRVQPDLTVDEPFIDDNVVVGAYPVTGYGTALDETPGVAPVFCGALRNADRVQCFTDVSGLAANPSMSLNQGTGGGSRPVAVALDPPTVADPTDRLFVSLDGSGVLREYTFDDTARSAVTFQRDIDLAPAGVGTGELGDVVVAPGTGNLIVAHRQGGRILRVQQSPLVITEIASGFNRPVGLAFDGASLLVVDEGEDAVFRITPDPASPGAF